MMSFTCWHTNTHKQCWNPRSAEQEGWGCLHPYLNFGSSSRHFGNVTHDVFGRHSFPSTTLTTVNQAQSVSHTPKTRTRDHKWKQGSPDDDALILPIDHHVSVHVVGQGVDMRWVLILGLQRPAERSADGGAAVTLINEGMRTHSSLVKLNLSVCEIRHLFEGINWYQHGADVCLSRGVKEHHIEGSSSFTKTTLASLDIIKLKAFCRLGEFYYSLFQSVSVYFQTPTPISDILITSWLPEQHQLVQVDWKCIFFICRWTCVRSPKREMDCWFIQWVKMRKSPLLHSYPYMSNQYVGLLMLDTLKRKDTKM